MLCWHADFIIFSAVRKKADEVLPSHAVRQAKDVSRCRSPARRPAPVPSGAGCGSAGWLPTNRPVPRPCMPEEVAGTQAAPGCTICVHRPGPTKSMACSMLLPGNATARGAVISRRPSNASGLMSARCSTGNRSASDAEGDTIGATSQLDAIKRGVIFAEHAPGIGLVRTNQPWIKKENA